MIQFYKSFAYKSMKIKVPLNVMHIILFYLPLNFFVKINVQDPKHKPHVPYLHYKTLFTVFANYSYA